MLDHLLVLLCAYVYFKLSLLFLLSRNRLRVIIVFKRILGLSEPN